MLSTLASVFSLLLSFGLLCLGHGLQNTLIGLRAGIEGYSDLTVGIMMSVYFVGFILGTKLAIRGIEKVGHIRCFAAFATVISAASLLHVLVVDSTVWVGLRLIYGMCIAGVYVVLESWLNALSTKENRGRIMSSYMVLNFAMLSAGQLFFKLSDGSGFLLFGIVSVLCSLALVPIILSKSIQPEVSTTESLTLRSLYLVSPLATVGALFTGAINGSFWTMSAIALTKLQLNAEDTGLFLSIALVGGLLFQWPIGWLSDLLNRRLAIMISGLITALTAGYIGLVLAQDTLALNPLTIAIAVLYGMGNFTLYALCIAHANDFVKPGMFVKASAALLTLNAIGSVCGPLISALMMDHYGGRGLFIFIAIAAAGLVLYATMRAIIGRKAPDDATTDQFVPVPRTSGAVYQLDPRGEE